MIITYDWLERNHACSPAIEWGKEKGLVEMEHIDLVRLLIRGKRFADANWLIVHNMEYKQLVSYAVFAAELVIKIYEKKYPNDNSLRSAIEAAKQCINDPSNENKSLAAIISARLSISAIAKVGVDRAATLSVAAMVSATDRESHWSTTYAAVDLAVVDWTDSQNKTTIKILNYGLKLLEKKDE